jgi:kynurenine formamidase
MQRWKRRPEGSNWGDFGEDDQIGRMNLLTPERRLSGVAEVKEGHAFTLSLPLDYPGWTGAAMGREPPRLSTRNVGTTPAFNYPFAEMVPGSRDLVCDDAVTLSTQYSTQWDSLAHWGRMFDVNGDGIEQPVYYNGYRAGTDLVGPNDENGPYAHRLGIENLAMAGVQGRGVLVDLYTRHEDSVRPVGYDALMRDIEAQQVEVRAGDFLLFWTGYDDMLLSMDKQPDPVRLQSRGASLDGHDPALLRWIDDSGVVAICADNPAVETISFAEGCCAGGKTFLPLHELCLFKLGIHLGELWYISHLATWLRAHQRSAFLLTAPPLRLPGSVGSPLTPIATV